MGEFLDALCEGGGDFLELLGDGEVECEVFEFLAHEDDGVVAKVCEGVKGDFWGDERVAVTVAADPCSEGYFGEFVRVAEFVY